MHILWALLGILLILVGGAWAVYWYVMSAFTTDTGSVNEMTYSVWFVAAFGLVLVGVGIWLVL